MGKTVAATDAAYMAADTAADSAADMQARIAADMAVDMATGIAASDAADAAARAGTAVVPCAHSPRFLLVAGHFPAHRNSCGASGTYKHTHQLYRSKWVKTATYHCRRVILSFHKGQTRPIWLPSWPHSQQVIVHCVWFSRWF